MEEIEMTVTDVENLPEEFRPPTTGSGSTANLPRPLADLIREATSGLTAAERGAFLDRLHRERPKIFSDEADGNPGFTKEEWRGTLTRWLKEEANRFMSAAVGLQPDY
jgi:hypothetical protein